MDDEPHLGPHLHWIWRAFTDLNYRRGVGMSGPLPFTYSDIEAYCRLKGIYLLGERERLLRLLDPLDREWMTKAHEEASKGSKSGPPPPPTHSPPRDGGQRNRTKQV